MLDRAVLRNSGKKLLSCIEGGLVNDGFMGALRIVLWQLTPVWNLFLLQMVVPVLLLQERVAQVASFSFAGAKMLSTVSSYSRLAFSL